MQDGGCTQLWGVSHLHALNDVTFADNTENDDGGAIACQGMKADGPSMLTIDNGKTLFGSSLLKLRWTISQM